MSPRDWAPVLFTLTLASCSSDGSTPDCPPLPLYDVRSALARAEARSALRAASARGCVTLPAGFEGGAAGE